MVLLNWNGIDDTRECLVSARELTGASVTLVVVDNGSRDDQATTLAAEFPDVVVLPQETNIGYCGGCNVGMKYAMENGADFVMLLNNDTIVPPDLLENLFAGTGNLTNLGAVSPVILEYPEVSRVWFSDARWLPGTAQFALAPPGQLAADAVGKAAHKTEFACGCCALFPRETIEKVGYLDERYFAFYDDAEYAVRIRRAGMETYVVPTAVMYHKVSRSTPATISTYLLTRNRPLWMKENLGLAERLRSLPYLVRELLWHLLNSRGLVESKYASRKQSGAFVQGWADYMAGRLYKWRDGIEDKLF